MERRAQGPTHLCAAFRLTALPRGDCAHGKDVGTETRVGCPLTVRARSAATSRSVSVPQAKPGVVTGAVIIAACPLLAACKRGAPAAPPAAPPPAVGVVTVAASRAPVSYDFVAQTEASKTVEVRARVQGFLLRWLFEEGGRVKEGDLLFEIDPRSFEADLEIARAKLNQGEAQRFLAETTLQRLEQVAELGAVNPREMDEAQANLLNAKAAVRLAQGELANAELNMSYTKVHSPLNGRIGRAQKEQGSLVDAGSNSLLATVIQDDPIYVYFPIPEREILRWKEDVASGRIVGPEPGKVPVAVTLADGTKYPHTGIINFIDVRTDPLTGTAAVRAALPNAGGVLQPGQSVKASILGWERVDAITVPQRAVVQMPMGPMVMVVGQKDTVEPRPVTLGNWFNDTWIIESGLKPGERVVVDGLLLARPGAVVRPEPAKPQQASATAPGGAASTR